MALLTDVTCFLYSLLPGFSTGKSHGKPHWTQIFLRCTVSEFLELYPQHASLLPETGQIRDGIFDPEGFLNSK